MNTKSIRFRLITWYATLLAILFIFLGVGGYWGFKHYLMQTSLRTLEERAQQIGLTLVDYKDEDYIVDDINKHYAPEINDRFLRITRDDGKQVYISGLPKDGSFDPSHLPLLNKPVNQAFLREEQSLGVGGLLIYTLPFKVKSGTTLVLEVGISSRQIEDPLHGLLVTIVIGLPIVVGVAIGGGYLLIRRSLLLVTAITHAAEKITLGNISERLPIAKTGDELEQLSFSLNNMIARLEETFQHINRFTADASHELRTPLTILHCDLEAIIQKRSLDPQINEMIGSALEETERLAKIVEGLLEVARLDAGETKMVFIPLDLASLTLTTVEQIRLMAEDKEIELACQADSTVMVAGDPLRLKQIVVNLLDNAIKYTPSGATIDVKVISSKDHALLRVKDTGMGIPREALPHIFERFYRADKARSRQLAGYGLGLSIAKSICNAHGGYITASSLEGQGSCFTVQLPLIVEHSD